ncbi:MAG: hypothetical protein IPG10_17070 [Flavobacteriales bacterium]|nr:hypothetical protein [Flavobacteriales bacterium]MBK9075152.1 hypothetical protein [Flavobacteriales bacterium]
MDPKLRRTLTYVAIAVIMLCCSASAVLSLRSGHAARGASTFFAGLSFSILFWTTTRRRTEK